MSRALVIALSASGIVLHRNGTDPLREQIQEDTAENIVRLEKCEDVDCAADAVTACEELWIAKLKQCEEHAEDWAGYCPAPQYTDTDGKLRNCKKGCCSEVGQAAAFSPQSEELWKQCDVDSGDSIDEAEFVKCLGAKANPAFEQVVKDTARCLMEKCDLDGSGGVTRNEFVDMLDKKMIPCLTGAMAKKQIHDATASAESFIQNLLAQ